MELDDKTLGWAIRRLRIRKGLPLEDIAARASLSPISVRALELGRGSTLKTVLKVLNAMGETVFLQDWIEKSTVSSPLQALRKARRLAAEPKRAPRKKKEG